MMDVDEGSQDNFNTVKKRLGKVQVKKSKFINEASYDNQ